MKLKIRQPDDFHVHLRDGDILPMTVAETARVFKRAMVMPNLKPPVNSIALAQAYKARILAARAKGSNFEPLMSLYLTDDSSPSEIDRGFRSGAFIAAKLYPAHATTNAQSGVTRLESIFSSLETMEELNMPLMVHGESTRGDVDVFDREKVFIDESLSLIRKQFPKLRVVFEHITTRDAVEFVKAHYPLVGATITAHHLIINRNAMFEGGLRPHNYCLPVAKREVHRQALVEAAISGHPAFFLGTDSAPHSRRSKESECGCAGIFTSPIAIELYAQVFLEAKALDKLEAFASHFGAQFYGLPLNKGYIELEECEWTPPTSIDDYVIFSEGARLLLRSAPT